MRHWISTWIRSDVRRYAFAYIVAGLLMFAMGSFWLAIYILSPVNDPPVTDSELSDQIKDVKESLFQLRFFLADQDLDFPGLKCIPGTLVSMNDSKATMLNVFVIEICGTNMVFHVEGSESLGEPVEGWRPVGVRE